MSNVQIAIWLRRQAGADVVVSSRAQVLCDGFTQEISRFGFFKTHGWIAFFSYYADENPLLFLNPGPAVV
jgi:hypothetical protein